MFSTYLYNGNLSTQTITNGIDLSGKGGMVWLKVRNTTGDPFLYDTTRGVNNALATDAAVAQFAIANSLTSFGSTGFTLGTDSTLNDSGNTYASWTFREQAKFFDIVTYTGTGANRTIAHSLGAVPGSIIVKRTDTTGAWQVYHRSLANTQYLVLNDTAAAATGATRWNSTTPTSSVFSLGTDATVNASGGTYVAYLFAHNAGGFGLTGTDNVISCGSYTGTGSTPLAVTLGYEPQWLLVKKASAAANWYMQDVMRGMPISTYGANLFANLSSAEAANTWMYPTATGFAINDASINVNESGQTYIYIAIRRGPMKVPTLGTSVYNYAAGTGPMMWTAGWPVDFLMTNLCSNGTGAEGSETYWHFDNSTGIYWDYPATFSGWMFARAPSYFDVVCYTGDGTTNRSITHNLASTPLFLIVKKRSGAQDWHVYHSGLSTPLNKIIVLNSSNAEVDVGTPFWGVSSTDFSLPSSGGGGLNTNASTYVAYLFATCAGVSKVGSYTGNGSTQTINCGFTGGARFVLIKRTDSTGDWYVYDTARGMTTLTDPYLWLNSTAAEVATLGSVTTVSTGFALNSAILAAINVNAGTYIFFAVS
jgi:hypothetical protein